MADSVRLFVLIVLFVVVAGEASLSRPPLTATSLSELNDTQIHHHAILQQEYNHRPAIKSLHTRLTHSLDGPYDFCFDKERQGFALDWASRSLRDSCPPDALFRMPVPSAFNSIPSLGWAHDYMGWFWYQRTFVLEDLGGHPTSGKQQQQQLLIHFENVNYLACVWLQPLEVDAPQAQANTSSEAILLGLHLGGHLPFDVDMSELLERNEIVASSRTRFRLTVAVSNRLDEDTIPSGRMVDLSEQVGRPFERFQPDFDFFHFAGILGSVSLVRLAPLYLASVVRDMQRDGHSRSGGSQLRFNVCLAGDLRQLSLDDYQLKVKLFNLDETQIITEYTSKIGPPGSCYDVNLHLVNNGLQLKNWTLAQGDVNHLAALYLVSVELFKSKHQPPVDVYELRVGFNAAAAAEGIQLQGFGLHHEQLFSGRTMSLAAIMKDIYLLKQWGVNLIRTSHYPYSSQFLEACDQHGLLVVAESPAVALGSFGDLKLQLHKQILREMMERDHDHPSILMWSVANEPQSQLAAAKGYFESLTQYARQEMARFTVRAGRPLTAAIAQSERADLAGPSLDVVMVNRYMGWYEATGVVEAVRHSLLGTLCGWAERLPGKPLLVSEFGAEALPGLHRLAPVEVYSEEYQRDLLLEHERLFDELWQASRPHLSKRLEGDGASNGTRELCSGERINFLGSMVWNFADFSTHQSLERIGGRNSKGVFTQYREPKAAALAIREVYLRRLGVAPKDGATSAMQICPRPSRVG